MKHFLLVTVLLGLAVCLPGCPAAPQPLGTGPLTGLEHPSLHIMVLEKDTPPVAGSFGWGYALLKVPPSAQTSLSAIDERLHSAMRAEFTRKGLVFSESEPDILVSYAVAAAGEISAEELNRTYGDLIDPALFEMKTDLQYKRGVLVLDVVDRRSEHLLWRGAIMAELDTGLPEERKQQRCSDAVQALLRYYPRPDARVK